jgi:predicted XRE-type DNA-binding protein
MKPLPPLKPLFWVGSSRKDLRGFPAEVHDDVGYRKRRAAMKKKAEETAVEQSSGNVFADLGLPNPEELLAKADLGLAIAREIEARRLTQAEAADLLGVAQPDVSNLMRGRLTGYSIERLTRLLNLLGRDVEIRVGRARTGAKRGHLRVAAR